jgi:hypothetical protein
MRDKGQGRERAGIGVRRSRNIADRTTCLPVLAMLAAAAILLAALVD